MTPLDPSLLAAILDPANEVDDALRLAAADWLEEHDEPERAEFIRLQLKTQWPIGVLDSWRQRERELLEAHGRAWACEPLGEHWGYHDGALYYWQSLQTGPVGCPLHITYRRGFIHSITCTAADWLAHAEVILAAQPVRQVTLTTWPEVQREPDRNGAHSVRLCQGQDWRLVDQTCTDSQATPLLLAAEWPHVSFTLPKTARGSSWQHIGQAEVFVRDEHLGTVNEPWPGPEPPLLRLSPLEEDAGATGDYTVPEEFVWPLQQAIPSSRDARRQRKQRQARK